MSGHNVKTAPAAKSEKKFLGYLVEFGEVHDLIHGAEKMRDEGFTHWDCHTPFPVHGLNDAMGLRATRLPYFVFVCGFAGLFLGILMQWWMNAYDYAINISGKPFWSLAANIPVAFEMTILFAAFGAFFGMLAFNRLPKYYHMAFNSEKFARATNDRFFISVGAGDPKFDEQSTQRFLETIEGGKVEAVYGEEG